MECPPGSDHTFGPQVRHDCRSFDFTLQFEDSLLGCLPAAAFLVLAAAHVARLVRSPVAYQLRAAGIVRLKLTSLACLLAAQLALLAVRARAPAAASGASLPADVLASLAALVAAVLSALSYQRAERPSTVLSLYLSAAVLLGTARVRTLWIISGGGGGTDVQVQAATGLATVVLALSAAALAWESAGPSGRKTAAAAAAAGRGQPPAQFHPDPTAEGPATITVTASEQHSSFWSRTTYAWLASTFWRGHRQFISLDDLPPLDTRLESARLCEQLSPSWENYDHHGRQSLLWATFRCYLASFLSAVVPRLCQTAFTFAQPFLITATLNHVEQPAKDRDYGRGLIGAWALVYVGLAVSTSVYQYQSLRFVTRIRGALISLVYQRMLLTQSAGLGSITGLALMGTDVERIVAGVPSLHEAWASLLEIGIACWLLERQMSLACIAPIILVAVFIAATSKVSLRLRDTQVAWIEMVQERLRVTAAVLGDIKAVKMFGVSSVGVSVIQGLRRNEIDASRRFRKNLVAIMLLSLTPINLAPVLSFAIYSVVAVFWKDETLLAAKAFTSLTLISLLTAPVIVFVQGLPNVVQCLGNFDRIQKFCSYGRDEDSRGERENDDDDDVRGREQPIRLQGAGYSWNKDGPETHVLRNMDIHLPRGRVTAVVGPTGCGKSSLMSGLLGELHVVPSAPAPDVPGANERAEKDTRPFDGIVGYPVAYCAQSPWLENGMIRHNIVGASKWDSRWYKTVCAVCCLAQDLAQLKSGDMTLVGSKGVNLSGGQKQRVALARAVYSKHRVLLLDDVFSSMDAQTAEMVLTCLLGRHEGLLRNEHTTVVLTTNSLKIMELADMVIVLEDGKATEMGSPAALLQNKSGYLRKLGLSELAEGGELQLTSANKNGISVSTYAPGEEMLAAHYAADATAVISMDEDEPESTAARQTDLRRKNGELSVYIYYLKSSGYIAVALYAASITAWIFCTEFSTIWVSWWSAANALHPNEKLGMYMGVYAVFGVAGTAAACGAAWCAYICIISNSASTLHLDLLEATSRQPARAPFRFFASTDTGELLNRFSEDMELIDMDLPGTALNYTSTALSCFAQAVVLAVYSRSLAIAMPFIAAFLYVLQRFYLQTSRQMRLLMIEAKAPLYTLFSEMETPGSSGAAGSGSRDKTSGKTSGNTAATGAITIRAFGWQRAYAARVAALIDRSQQPAYVQSCIQHWLAFVLTLAMAVLMVVLIATVVTWQDRLDISTGGVGVSLIVLIGLSTTLTRLVRTWTRLESSVGAVARVRRFVAETEIEADAIEARVFVPKQQTQTQQIGTVWLDDLAAAYQPGAAPSVLQHISLLVPSGEHLAICGRSGSGKTSLVLALLRMMDIRSGRITVRGRVSVVSQDPFLVPGTSLRFNMNMNTVPSLEAASDSQIVGALQRVGLWEVVQRQGGSNGTNDDSSSSSSSLDQTVDFLALSAGQRQLLCFARAVVQREQTDVLVLDEATSSLDSAADAVVQSILDTEFRGCTLLAVMHRLTHVASYDRVAVIDAGTLVELGAPGELIANESSRFAEMLRFSRRVTHKAKSPGRSGRSGGTTH